MIGPIVPADWTVPSLASVGFRSQNPLMLHRTAGAIKAYCVNTVVGGTWIYGTPDQGDTYNQFFNTGLSGTLRNLQLQPDGSCLVTNMVGGSANGSIYRIATFETAPQAPVRATVEGSPLVMSRANNYVHEAWGLYTAPAGSAREGLVVATEYGPQSAGADADATSPKIWLSLDYGQTFRVIGNLYAIAGGKINQHMHGVVYDHYNDAILASYGDANGSGGKSGIVVSYDWQSATPTWTHIYGPTTGGAGYNTGAWHQATTMYCSPKGILCGSDGLPNGIFLIRRNGDGTYGPMVSMMVIGGGTSAYTIAQRIHQQTPDSPFIIGWQRADAKADAQSIITAVSADAEHFYELYVDTTGSGSNPAGSFVGPINGKVFGEISNDGRATLPARTILVGSV